MKREQEWQVLLLIPMAGVGLSCSPSPTAVLAEGLGFSGQAIEGRRDCKLDCRVTTGGRVTLESVLHCRAFCVNKKSAFVVLGGEAQQLTRLCQTVQSVWRANLGSSFGSFPYSPPTSKQPNHCRVSHFSSVFPLSQAQTSSCVEGCSCWKWRGEMATPLPFGIPLSLVT